MVVTAQEPVQPMPMVAPQTSLAVMRHEWSEEEKKIIRESLCPADINEPAFRWYLAAAEASGLNPIQREIYIVKYGSRFVLQTGIDGFLIHAERSGKFGGFMPTEFTVKSKDGNLEVITIDHYDPDVHQLVSATVKLIRKDMGGEVRQATCLFTEYAVYYNNKLSDRWQRAGARQLEKCTQAKVIRENCPGLGQVYVHEEMEQARATGDFIDADFAPVAGEPGTAPVQRRRGRQPKKQTLLPAQEPEATPEPEQSTAPAEKVTATEQETTGEAETAPQAEVAQPADEAPPAEPYEEVTALLDMGWDWLNNTHKLGEKEGGSEFAEELIQKKFGVKSSVLVPVERLEELKTFFKGEMLNQLEAKGFVPPVKRGA